MGEYIQNSHISRFDPVDGSIILSPLLSDAKVDEMLKCNFPFVAIGKLSEDIKALNDLSPRLITVKIDYSEINKQQIVVETKRTDGESCS